MKLFWITLLLCLKAHSETQVFEAVATHEGKAVYLERHTVVYDDKTLIRSQIEYLGPEGKPIANLVSDYTQSLSAPSYIFRDLREQSIQGLHWNGQMLELFSQKKDDKVSVSQMYKGSELLIGGEGLIYYIGAHIHELIKVKGMDFKFVIPGRLSSFDFTIQPVSSNNEEVTFEIKLKSWLLRLFGPRLKLIYDLQRERIKSFQGLSHIRKSDGSMMTVDVDYVYGN